MFTKPESQFYWQCNWFWIYDLFCQSWDHYVKFLRSWYSLLSGGEVLQYILIFSWPVRHWEDTCSFRISDFKLSSSHVEQDMVHFICHGMSSVFLQYSWNIFFIWLIYLGVLGSKTTWFKLKKFVLLRIKSTMDYDANYLKSLTPYIVDIQKRESQNLMAHQVYPVPMIPRFAPVPVICFGMKQRLFNWRSKKTQQPWQILCHLCEMFTLD